MEKRLFDAFIAKRNLGRPVRDSWFRFDATELGKLTYPELHATGLSSKFELFVFFSRIVQ
jgi:hypothetical protein